MRFFFYAFTAALVTSVFSPVHAQNHETVQQATASALETQNEAEQPEDRWNFVLPARSAPLSPRRSEMWVTVNSPNPPVLAPGRTVVFEADIVPVLGAAAASDHDWHVMLQLHGPTQRGWPGPVLGLTVRNGHWRLSGGAGHPNHDWSTNNMEWVKFLDPYVNGAKKHVRLEVLLSANPNVGYVTLDLDGRRVVDRFRPRTGTWYPDQVSLGIKTGLYRGTDKDANGNTYPTIPTYTQSSQTRRIKFRVY